MNRTLLRRIRSLFRKPGVEPKSIIGVVESVVGGSQEAGNRGLILFVNPWKDEHGRVHRQSLRLASEGPATWAELRNAKEQCAEGGIWRFRVLQHDDWHELIGIDAEVEDGALQSAMEHAEAPTLIKDEVLGRLYLDRKLNCYEGKWTFRGQECELSVQRSSGGDRDANDITRARRVLQLEAHGNKIDDALKTLTCLYNDCWRAEDDEVLEPGEFLSKLNMQAVVAHADGDFTAVFDSADLFLDHGIEVRLHAAGEVIDVRLS